MRRISVAGLAAAFFAPTVALAHTGHDGFAHSFASGFQHPFGGADHLLAMFAVGLLAVQLGARALWLVPAAFVGVMILGSLAGLGGVSLPGAEYMIALSIVAIALPVALALGMPVLIAMAFVGVFAFFHGYAHGTELPAGDNAAQYILGFALATAVIHAIGIAVGLLAGTFAQQVQGYGLRIAGGAVAITGLALFIS